MYKVKGNYYCSINYEYVLGWDENEVFTPLVYSNEEHLMYFIRDLLNERK